jgi:hypothetical protein
MAHRVTATPVRGMDGTPGKFWACAPKRVSNGRSPLHLLYLAVPQMDSLSEWFAPMAVRTCVQPRRKRSTSQVIP